MKKLLTALALAATTLAVSAQAPATPATPASASAASAPAKTPLQTKMASCNDQAAGKAGDERKAFMKECLSTKRASQTDKMRTCNEQAKGKKGEERKTFMKTCLSS
jgi:hypothetical protein